MSEVNDFINVVLVVLLNNVDDPAAEEIKEQIPVGRDIHFHTFQVVQEINQGCKDEKKVDVIV